MLNIVSGDILETEIQYIAHQCNCVSSSYSGLAYGIFTKYPYANIYEERSSGKYIHLPGDIHIRGDGNNNRYVINIMGQIYPGGPNKSGLLEVTDNANNRKKFFYDCLIDIAEIPGLVEIAFPYRIGCGLAGGNWEEYEELLKKFAVYVEHKRKAEVYILKNG